eukprot:TRINITY_DN5708_c0_g1_i1.p1 TRINITY_DN5708_c0_g1~~TRINITY_DN5708_c0_g1_i1.p1  ORF type:complete len:259 (+),score=19.53 TRINITY_DN5708_c0_g1_i1:60-836(+)
MAIAVARPRRDVQAGPYNRQLAVPTQVHRPVVKRIGNMLDCTSVEQWHSPEAANHQGLRVVRHIDPESWQFVADQFARDKRRFADIECGVISQAIIELRRHHTDRQRQLEEGALAVSQGLPPELAEMMRQDAHDMAVATCRMLPHIRNLTIKLELFEENVCKRWHQDSCVCRSLVAYNCAGTEYTANENVDFHELLHGGINEHIIRDTSLVQSINVGDILMMKGTKFPGRASGLVHKSPLLYQRNGKVFPRLVLKVDV